MRWTAVRKGLSFVVPEAVLLAGAVVALRLPSLHDPVAEFARFYPYIVFGLGLLLALRFQRSRLVFALLLLALVQWGLDYAPAGLGGAFLFQAAAALLPLNLAAVTLMTERGTLTRVGMVRLAALAAQVVALVALARFAPAPAAAVVNHELLPSTWLAWTPLAHGPVLAFTLSIALVVMGIVFHASATGRAFLWSLVAAFLGLHFHASATASTVYFSTAALILVVAVIEASYLMAYHDGLTGLPARRALNEALQRIDGRYTVAMVDVDHFKRLNDRYGHDVGDQLLRLVAACLGKVTGGGRAFRYGGEEFAVIFPNKGVAQCLPDLEALRHTIEQSRFTLRRRLRPRRKPAGKTTSGGARSTARHVSLTVSIGAAEPNGRQKTPDSVIQAADRALYRAKESGRNRVNT